MKNTPRTIIFCGLDGCGKTTQAKILQDYLKNSNIKSNYVWLRYPFRLIIPFVSFLRIFKLSAYPRTIEKTKKGIKNLEHHKFLGSLWEKLLYQDLKIDYNSKVTKPLNENIVIILDRSIIDTVVDLVIVTGNDEKLEQYIKKFSNLLPLDSKIFFLDIPPELSFERNKDEYIETLKIRKNLYQKIGKIMPLQTIDGTQQIKNIHKQILSFVEF